MNWIMGHIWLILFFIWGIPLTYYRSKFRKMVYQTDHWLINIQPRFVKEIKAISGFYHPEKKEFIRYRNFYRFYLMVYLLLFTAYMYLDN